MKIKIIQRPPVNPDLEIELGNIYETVGGKEERRGGGVWILGKGGEPVKLIPREFEILDPEHSSKIPGGFYVVRGPDGITVGMELGKGGSFSLVKMQTLLNLFETERRALYESWTDGDDESKWEWETSAHVSMSPDIRTAILEQLSDKERSKWSNNELRSRTRDACSHPDRPKVERMPVLVKDVCRSYVEMIATIEKP